MLRKRINQLIGYGILVFVGGFVLGLAVNKYFQLLIPIGTISTYLGIIIFFRTTNLKAEFEFSKDEDFLTYFWNKIVLKFWTFVFSIWMLILNMIFISSEFMD